MYPLKFENLYYGKVWGGKDFKRFRDNVPVGKIGESWDVACHSNGISVIKNGKYKGTKLDELIEMKGKDLLGSKISKNGFPLLIKILNTSDKLSIQVHPDDEYAHTYEREMGKTEAWYVMEAKEGSSIILGTNGCTKEEFEKGIKDKDMEKYMNKIQVKKGDVYYLKSGLIHSMGPGIVIAEIQQNSDTTYRVHDYDRGREVHIEKALNVIDFNIEGKRSRGIKVEGDNYDKVYYCLNEHFALELYNIKNKLDETSDEERFFIFTCVEGNGLIKYKNIEVEINIGDSILIPANLGKYEIIGELRLLKSYMPSIDKVEGEILGLIK